jgi:O-antigen ligase
MFGVGQGNFKDAYSSHLRPDISESRKHAHAHNDLLNIAAISGIPGAVFSLGMWITVLCYFWKGWRRMRNRGSEAHFMLAALAGSIVFFVSALFEATFADEEVRQMLMFVWAAGLWPWCKVRQDAQQ